jgi:hypothetical protein
MCLYRVRQICSDVQIRLFVYISCYLFTSCFVFFTPFVFCSMASYRLQCAWRFHGGGQVCHIWAKSGMLWNCWGSVACWGNLEYTPARGLFERERGNRYRRADPHRCQRQRLSWYCHMSLFLVVWLPKVLLTQIDSFHSRRSRFSPIIVT